MPERIFKYYTTKDLIAEVTALGKTIASGAGSVNQVRNSNTGFLVQTGEVNDSELRDKFKLGRYEIWLRGQGVDGNAAEPNCAALEKCNPLREKVMRVHTVYGWPFPYQTQPGVL